MFAVGIKRNEKGIKDFDIPMPRLTKGNEVLIRILKAGICGTDRNIVEHHLFDMPDGQDIMVLGHESFGVVEEIGKNVAELKKGDYVTATARRGCGECASCLNNQSDMCFTGRYKETGLHGLNGFFTTYVVVEEEYAVKVPKEAEKIGVLAEPMSIVNKAINQAVFVQSRLPWSCSIQDMDNKDLSCRNAVVIGAGPIGFLACCLLRLYDIGVHVLERKDESNYRIKLLKGIGVDYIDIRKADIKNLYSMTGNIDLMFEASGASELAINLIPQLGRNGVYVMTGIPRGELHATFDMNLMLRHIVRYNQAIIGTINGNRTHFANSLSDMIEIEKKFDSILSRSITTSYRLSDYKEAIFDKNPDNIKVVFDMSMR